MEPHFVKISNVFQAPNASLCLAIVDLYINSKAACGLLLKFCNDLSQYLQGPNPEVDVSIVSGYANLCLSLPS